MLVVGRVAWKAAADEVLHKDPEPIVSVLAFELLCLLVLLTNKLPWALLFSVVKLSIGMNLSMFLAAWRDMVAEPAHGLLVLLF